MGNKFYITQVNSIDNDKCLREAVEAFPEGVDKCVKQCHFAPEDDAPEVEEMLAFVDGESISGVKINLLQDGDTSVFLGWNASGMDVTLCFAYMRAVQKNYPQAVILCADSDGNKSDVVADLSEEALIEAWVNRVNLLAGMIEADEERINIPALRYHYHLLPEQFRRETEGMSLEDRVMKLYHDIVDLQWYNCPEPKSYMLRWNPAVSNVKLEDFEELVKNASNPDFCLSWSIYDWQEARVGDTVYMLRVGEGKTGIVMRGEIISEPYLGEDWSGKGRATHYVDIAINQIMNPETSNIISLDSLNENWPDEEWAEGHSGTLIGEQIAYQLDKMFDRYLVDNREQFTTE